MARVLAWPGWGNRAELATTDDFSAGSQDCSCVDQLRVVLVGANWHRITGDAMATPNCRHLVGLNRMEGQLF